MTGRGGSGGPGGGGGGGRPTLLLATRNPHKAKEMGEILSDALVREAGAEEGLPRLVSLLDFPDVVPPEETGASYRENAEAKARAAAQATGLLALADDSGLEVDALGGEPGIRSARWLGAGASQRRRNRRILEALEGRDPAGRRARFRCAVGVARPGPGGGRGRGGPEAAGGPGEAGSVRVFEATLEGFIAAEESGGSGFGYDPIFLPAEGGRPGRPGRRTLAELSPSEKNRISHRGQAIRLAAAYLAGLL